ncbi:MAG: LacI family DNA-binding transcriptional regulator [Phycicoccus sp.]|nr:LacI family DNA-binding transcriptional regulator [Phycicoccus sp.]
MRDVAERAGTSTAVVSYVLNNGPRPVAAATRERVLQAAAEVGYKLNLTARALRVGTTRTTGLVVPDITNPYFAELARALEDEVAQLGNLLVIGDSALSHEQEERHCRVFIERQVGGIVLLSLADTAPIVELAEAGIPIVVLHPVPDPELASTLTIDYDAAAAVATRHLLDHGYTDLRLLTAEPALGPMLHERGFRRAVGAHPDPVDHDVWRTPISRFAVVEALRGRFRSGDVPRAIYATTDEQAFGVLIAAYEAGLRVPQDVAVVGCDGTANSAVSIPPLTTIAQPRGDFARLAVEILGRPTGTDPVHDVLDFDFITRRSCGCSQDPAPSAFARR